MVTTIAHGPTTIARPSTSLSSAQDNKTAMPFCQFFVYFGEGIHGEFQDFV
jgi:hypothetical protein